MRFLPLALCLTIAPLVLGQVGSEPLFSRLSSEDGLSHNWVRCFFQDERGMIWIGTSDSLDRYDGREIKSFRPTAGESGKPLNVAINAVARRDAERFWVASDGGLYSFDRQKGTFEAVEETPRTAILHVMEDRRGRLWISSDLGLLRWDPGSDEWRRYRADASDAGSLSHDYVNAVFERSNGEIWVGTKGGLSIYDEAADAFRVYEEGRAEGALVSGDVLRAQEDREGRMWLATGRGGLERALPDGRGGWRFRQVIVGQGIRLLVDRDNYLWIALGSNGGLRRMDLTAYGRSEEVVVERFGRVPGDERSLSSDSIFCLFEDALGDIWIGTFGRGVNYYSKRSKQLEITQRGSSERRPLIDEAANVFWEEERYFWIGTNAGLQRVAKADGELRVYQSIVGDATTLGADSVFALLKDSRGGFWAGGWTTGLNRFDYETETFRQYLPSEEPGSIAGAIVFALEEDRQGRIWVGLLGAGVSRFDYATGRFETLSADPLDPYSLLHDAICDLLLLSDGRMLVSASSSVSVYDPATDRFRNFSREPGADNGNGGGYAQALHEDRTGRIWLATTSGLEILDLETGRHRYFGEEDGLPSNAVQAIEEDEEGNLWLSTSAGLSKFEGAVANPEAARFRNISYTEGLPSEQFIYRSSWKGSDGSLYFGSSDGYTRFRPEEIRFNAVPPRVALTELLMLETSPDSVLSYRPYEGNVDAVERVELPYARSNFIFKFAALNYLHPEKNRYRYKLDGYDLDWIDAGTTGSATYTQIKPGRYTFSVMGSNNDGVWSREAKTLELAIQPPWWMTAWFKLAALGAVVAVAVVTYRLRFAYLSRRRRELEAHVKARTAELESASRELMASREEIAEQNEELRRHRERLEEIVQERTRQFELAKLRAEESDRLKSSFIANLSHEIRTPMNAIIGFSSLLRGRGGEGGAATEEEQETFIDIIHQNGHSLLVLIDDILDISLIESNQVNLSREPVAVGELVGELREVHAINAQAGVEVAAEVAAEAEGLRLMTDPVRLRQVLNNLLSNAVKYTERGRVTLSCRREGEEVVFEVSDTGPGIAPENLKRVFDPFFKVEAPGGKLYRGTGIGLAIARNLARMMGGRVEAASEVGKGSRFTARLPVIEAGEGAEDIGDAVCPARLDGVTLVCAEDDEMNYELLRRLLKGTGARLLRAENGREAVELVSKEWGRGDLMALMDIKMPVMDGMEACRELKARFPRLRVVAVSAYAQRSERDRIMASGFDAFLAKPIDAEQLMDALGALAR